MMSAGPLEDVQTRFAAEQRIVAAVHQSELPNTDDIRIWLRGGAVFWNENHWSLAWGLWLSKAIDQESIADLGIRRAIEESDDIARYRFGHIPLRDATGNRAVAITAHNGFFGVQLLGFYRTADHFANGAPRHGWLLGQERDLSDALALMSDEDLTAIWSRNTQQPFR